MVYSQTSLSPDSDDTAYSTTVGSQLVQVTIEGFMGEAQPGSDFVSDSDRLSNSLIAIFVAHMHKLDFPYGPQNFRERYYRGPGSKSQPMDESLVFAVFAFASHIALTCPDVYQSYPLDAQTIHPGVWIKQAMEALKDAARIKASAWVTCDALLASAILARTALLAGAVQDAHALASGAIRLGMEAGLHRHMPRSRGEAVSTPFTSTSYGLPPPKDHLERVERARLWMCLMIIYEEAKFACKQNGLSLSEFRTNVSPPSPTLASLFASTELFLTGPPPSPMMSASWCSTEYLSGRESEAWSKQLNERYIATALSARARHVVELLPDAYMAESIRAATGCTLIDDIAEEYGALVGALKGFRKELERQDCFDALDMNASENLAWLYGNMGSRMAALAGTLVLLSQIAGMPLQGRKLPSMSDWTRMDERQKRAVSTARENLRVLSWQFSNLCTRLDEILQEEDAGIASLGPNVGYIASLAIRSLWMDMSEPCEGVDAEESQPHRMLNASHVDVLWEYLSRLASVYPCLRHQKEIVRNMLGR